MQLIRHFWNDAGALDRAVVLLEDGRRFPICLPDRQAELFRGAGLDCMAVRAIDVATDLRDFDDYWQPFLGG
jgi:hypothetical protein